VPRPRPHERQSHYLSRAIREMMDEGLSSKHAVGKAYGMFRYYGKKRRKR
jgi:hypothetical protein